MTQETLDRDSRFCGMHLSNQTCVVFIPKVQIPLKVTALMEGQVPVPTGKRSKKNQNTNTSESQLLRVPLDT